MLLIKKIKMAKKKVKIEEPKDEFLGYCIVPEGKLGILKNFRLEYENRDILFQQIEDGSIGIVISRPDKGESDVPQQLRLSELTLNLLLIGIFKFSEYAGIDSDGIMCSINGLKQTEYEKARE
jgi:hypothetical protein